MIKTTINNKASTRTNTEESITLSVAAGGGFRFSSPLHHFALSSFFIVKTLTVLNQVGNIPNKNKLIQDLSLEGYLVQPQNHMWLVQSLLVRFF
jgi:hypothetical protein